MPADLIATVALSASSVLLGMLLPLAAGVAIVGLVRALVEFTWGLFATGMSLTLGVVAAGVILRTWGGSLGSPEQLAAANQTAAVVFTAVTPLGVIIGAVLVAVALVRRYVGGPLERRRARRD